MAQALPKDPFGAPGAGVGVACTRPACALSMRSLADVLAELAEALQRKEQVDELERLYSQ